ncbi:DUF6960 family protein [Paenibacillus sp. GYB003]|jgi:hypothetical protein|uniref:DUF6960 family protein n=1 Tax=Paenibacillus sp. GYB003 TaxID=2994392 RepID=UPI002F968F5E
MSASTDTGANERYKGTWGLYPWFAEDGEAWIDPADLPRFQALIPYGKLFQCIEDGEYLTLRYGSDAFRVKPGLYKPVSAAPAFGFGSEVTVKSKPELRGRIAGIEWHFKNEAPFYYIEANGKRKSTRYAESDLAPA